MHPALFDSAAAALWLGGADGVGAYVRFTGFSFSDATTMAGAKITGTSAAIRIPIGNCALWLAFDLFISTPVL